MINFVRSDHIGRPVFATNASGVKVWTAAYLPFGGVRVTTGTPPTARFPGQWFQSETGLHQNWMRDYDPTTGRYMQADPLGLIDGASVYGYAGQNPGRYVDPRGLSVLKPLFTPIPNTDGALLCDDDDDATCREWFDELSEVYDDLILRGPDYWPVFEDYNEAAERYNEYCAGPGTGRPRLGLIPLDPNRGNDRNFTMPVPPLILPPRPRFGGGGWFNLFPPLPSNRL